MAELKTKQNDASVEAFLQGVEDPRQRHDAFRVLELMKEITAEPPKMWGTSMVGFGSYHYKYASGREGDWFLTGFSPRKGSLTLYIMPGLDQYGALLQQLGKHKTGKSCLYIKRLDDVDLSTLRELVGLSVGRLTEAGGNPESQLTWERSSYSLEPARWIISSVIPSGSVKYTAQPPLLGPWVMLTGSDLKWTPAAERWR